MEPRKIVYRKLEELNEYSGNPRVISDESVEVVANSIKEFGITNPILIDENDVIVAGHTRAKACRSLGISDVPTICLSDLSDEQIKAYRLVDNKSGELSAWDFDLLGVELDEILDIDMSDFGFENLDTTLFDNLDSFTGDEAFAEKPPQDFFAMTFQIPSEYKVEFDNYTFKKGKDALTREIIELVKNTTFDETESEDEEAE